MNCEALSDSEVGPAVITKEVFIHLNIRNVVEAIKRLVLDSGAKCPALSEHTLQ